MLAKNLNLKAPILKLFSVASLAIVVSGCTNNMPVTFTEASQHTAGNQKAGVELMEYEPQGEYAVVAKNIKESNELAAILNDRIAGNKPKAAAKMEANLGKQYPPALYALSYYYLDLQNLEKATTYLQLAEIRAKVDVRASRNTDAMKDLIDVIVTDRNNELTKLGKSGFTHFKKIARTTVNNVIKLDKTTPRDYDMRWPSLHTQEALFNKKMNYASGKELQNIIEDQRRLALPRS